MFSSTHIYIAKEIINHLNNNGIAVDETYFKYGSIKPDYAPQLYAIQHYEIDSIKFITDEIKYLSSRAYNSSRDFLKEYSVRLGVIAHYIADYFCHAHNSKTLRDNKFKHFMYELKLRRFVKRLDGSSVNMQKHMFDTQSTGAIINYIFAKLAAYRQANVSYFNDLKCAIEACCTVCRLVVSLSMGNTKPAVL